MCENNNNNNNNNSNESINWLKLRKTCQQSLLKSLMAVGTKDLLNLSVLRVLRWAYHCNKGIQSYRINIYLLCAVFSRTPSQGFYTVLVHISCIKFFKYSQLKCELILWKHLFGYSFIINTVYLVYALSILLHLCLHINKIDRVRS